MGNLFPKKSATRIIINTLHLKTEHENKYFVNTDEVLWAKCSPITNRGGGGRSHVRFEYMEERGGPPP